MTIGSLQYLENEFKSAKEMGSKVYNNARRLDPISLNDAFRDESKGSIFDLEKINSQITHNDNVEIKNTLVRGNFSWKEGQKDTEVIWTPNSQGRFLIAWLPPKELQNRWIEKNNVFGGRSKHPLNDDIGCFGADTTLVKSSWNLLARACSRVSSFSPGRLRACCSRALSYSSFTRSKKAGLCSLLISDCTTDTLREALGT